MATPPTIDLEAPTARDDGAPPRHRRAAAMAPEARRAAIVAATLPLLLEHGAGVTTRQIAEAAGIAEGTIFRVFPDKESVIDAVVEQAFDPVVVDDALYAIDRSLPLESRLVEAVGIIQRRLMSVWQLMTAVGMTKPPSFRDDDDRPTQPDLSALAAVFEPDRDRLRREPESAARILRGLSFGCTHPAFVVDDPLPASEIVSLALDGMLRRDGPTPST